MEAGDLIVFPGPTGATLVLWGADKPEVALYPSPLTGCNPFLLVEVAEA